MKKVSKKVAAVLLVATVVGSGSAMAAYIGAGPQSNTTGINPHGWLLSPAGKHKLQVVQTIPYKSPETLFLGVVFSPNWWNTAN